MSGRLSRRELMRGGAGLAGLTLSEPTPALAAASYAPETVVLVQLAGGADGASLLVPYTEERYYQARPTLALPPPGRSTHATLALDDRHALHPALRALEGLYHAGELGFVVGVGMPALVRSHCDARRSLAASVTGLLGGRAPLRMHGAPAAQLAQAFEQLRLETPPRALELELPGWDTHAAQGDAAEGRFAQAARELAATLMTLHHGLGARLERVLVVVLTEFGRSLTETPLHGTDDGHASVLMVLGGGQRWGRVLGRAPRLTPEHLTSGRHLEVTEDVRLVLARLALGEAPA